MYFADDEVICGPYWRALIQSYDLGHDDTIMFHVINGTLNLEILAVFDTDLDAKVWLGLPGNFGLQ